MDQGENSSIINAITAAGNYAGLWVGSLDNRLGRLRDWIDDGRVLLATQGKDPDTDPSILYVRTLWLDNKQLRCYDLLASLARRLNAGDVVLDIKEVGDSCGEKAHFEQLCKKWAL